MARGRSMTLPTSPGRTAAIYKPAEKLASDPAHGAAFIFVHGLGDTAEGLENVADQFQKNHKLDWMHWIIPNALENRDAMTTAWYQPTAFSPIPSDRPELEEAEDEVGLLESVKYIESLIDACVSKGIPPQRIVLGGFSQGCALSLLTDLCSGKYGGKLAGIVGLMGYLPLSKRLQHLRAHAELPVTHGDVPIFMARGQKDMLVPKRIYSQSLKVLDTLGATGVESHDYEGLGHSLSGPLLKDVCTFLEKVVPDLGD